MSGLDDPENAMWFHLGRADMLSELARTYFEESGDRFKRGEDVIAHYLRSSKESMHKRAGQERNIAGKFERKTKEEMND